MKNLLCFEVLVKQETGWPGVTCGMYCMLMMEHVECTNVDLYCMDDDVECMYDDVELYYL
jgi:hypothetical protein